VPTEQLVDTLFEEIDKYVGSGARRVDVDERSAAEGAAWLQAIEDENAGDLTPERLAAMEKAQQAAEAEEMSGALLETVAERARLDESVSPTAGRRFTRT
jgi:(E)-4-hydroxy-3-methylbut-2-enyl-diphosphate synthase